MTSSRPLCALGLLLTTLLSVSSYPTGGRQQQQQQQYASWDDVNVVAHGLLQLGQALKEHVDKSKAQMKELNAGLKSVNATLQRLEEQDRRGHRSEDMSQVDELIRRVDRLDQRVDEVIRKTVGDSNSSDDANGSFQQRMMAAQNRRIDQLMEKIRQQQDKLDKQSVHLQALQSKIGHKRMKSLRRHGEVEQKQERQQKDFAKDCHELFIQGQKKSGVYTVQPEGEQPFSVLCDMTLEGGWTVIQKRFDGSQSFDQAWDSYKRGFGSLNGEFWLGLDHIHSLSKQGRYMLKLELSDWSGQSHVVSSEFRLGGEEGGFSLHLGPQSEGGLPFTTADHDNDLSVEDNCAQIHSGGWWFSSCGDSNLNGEFPSSPSGSRDMFWTSSEGQRTVLRSTVMKMAPVSVSQPV